LNLSIKYQKYSITDAQGKVILTSNFSAPIDIHGSLLPIIHNDFTNFNNIAVPGNVVSRINIKSKDAEYEIIRDYVKKSIVVSKNGQIIPENILSILSVDLENELTNNQLSYNFLNFESIQINSLNDFQKLFGTSGNQTLNKADFSDEELRKISRLTEVKLRIKGLDEDVGFYQNKRKSQQELEKELENLEKENEINVEKLKSVSSLIEVRKKIMTDLQKFGNMASDVQLEQKVQQLKRSRLSQVLSFLLGIKNHTTHIVSQAMDEERAIILVAKGLLLLPFIQVFISLSLYLLSRENKVLYLGFITLLLNILLFILINVLRDRKVNNLVERSNDSKLSFAAIAKQFENRDQEKFFVNAAWITALKQETQTIENTISNNLKGKKYVQIEEELKNSKEKLKSVKQKLENLNNKSVSSEEYLKKRRELDMLQIEKDNLIAILNKNIKFDEKAIFDNNGVGRSNVDNKLPVILVNIGSLSQSIKTKVDDYIQMLKESQQIIVINVM